MSADLAAILGPAVAICVAVALVHVPLGIEVLRRGIVFIDLAIAQIAGLAIVLARLAWHEPPWLALQAIAGAAAVLAAIGFRWIERKSPREQEAVIGASFIVAASATLLALADHPHGGEEIQHVLSGQVLFVTWHEVARTLPAFAGILALWFLWPGARRGLPFFILFAVTVTQSVQLVGVYVVFASLILPALAAKAVPERSLPVAWGAAFAAVAAGISAAHALDLPAGPALVVAFAASAIAFRVASRTASR